MICEILAAGITGGGTARDELMDQETICNNMLMIVIDPAGFGADIPFRDEIDRLVEHVSSSQPAQGFDKVRFPGDPERETTAERTANGIWIDDNTWGEMRRAGLEVGMSEADFAG
jgi:uncharacterized oxidoreductase